MSDRNLGGRESWLGFWARGVTVPGLEAAKPTSDSSQETMDESSSGSPEHESSDRGKIPG